MHCSVFPRQVMYVSISSDARCSRCSRSRWSLSSCCSGDSLGFLSLRWSLRCWSLLSLSSIGYCLYLYHVFCICQILRTILAHVRSVLPRGRATTIDHVRSILPWGRATAIDHVRRVLYHEDERPLLIMCAVFYHEDERPVLITCATFYRERTTAIDHVHRERVTAIDHVHRVFYHENQRPLSITCTVHACTHVWRSVLI